MVNASRNNGGRSAPGALILLLLCSILAVLVHTTSGADAQTDLDRQLELKRNLTERVQAMRIERERSRIFEQAILADPQTLEGELRRLGYCRPGEVPIPK